MNQKENGHSSPLELPNFFKKNMTGDEVIDKARELIKKVEEFKKILNQAKK